MELMQFTETAVINLESYGYNCLMVQEVMQILVMVILNKQQYLVQELTQVIMEYLNMMFQQDALLYQQKDETYNGLYNN